MIGLKMEFKGDIVHCDKKVYFLDCGEVSRTVSKIYGGILPIDGFIANENDTDTGFINSKKIYSLNDVLNEQNKYIVVATNKSVNKIYAHLENAGLIPNEDFCHYKEWIRAYFAANLNDRNKLFQDYVELYITDRCTLRCKSCILFAPYVTAPHDRSLNDIRWDIDLYFKYVDKVSVFRLMGGEPFLHRNFDEVIDIIIRGGVFEKN